MARPRKVNEFGQCGRCAYEGSAHHCGACPCCRTAPPASMAGRTRVFAFVRADGPCDHTHHYVRRTATSRIPSHGKVALRYRDRKVAAGAVRATLGNARAMRDAIERDVRLPLQSRTRG